VSVKGMKIGILGPAGTFTETAAVQWLKESVKNDTGELNYYDTIFEVAEGLLKQEVDYGIVPIENSLEGSVGETLDVLSGENAEGGMQIVGEILVPIRICLMAKQNLSLKKKALAKKHVYSSHEEDAQALTGIKTIVSRPHALAQCKRFLRERCKGLELKAVDSTAAAAKLASQSEELAALASEEAAAKYGLIIIAEDVQDRDSVTRFVVLSSSGIKTYPTGNDKTSILLYLKDSPGALYDTLGEFAQREINLTKIESRPSKRAMGDYMFHIDCEGHIEEKKLKEALEGVKTKVAVLKTLGAYPVASGY